MSDCIVEDTNIDSFLVDYFPDSPKRYELLIVNRESPKPVAEVLKNLFSEQPLSLKEVEHEDMESNCVLLVNERGKVVSKTPLEKLEEAILLVNSDLYMTRDNITLNDIPSVLSEITDIPFMLSGYPESNTEKLLLTVISRYIEYLSINTDRAGQHRASFQYLNRIKDESGTYNVYRKLGQKENIDTHIYGVPDTVPSEELGVKIHGGYTTTYKKSWFVTHLSERESAALVALETGVNKWCGFWTQDREKVRDIVESIQRHL